MSGSAVDPFAATVVPISGNMFSLLQYARQAIKAGAGGYRLDIFPHSLRPMTHMYQAAINHVFQNIMRLRHIMFPILAAFSRRLRLLNDSPFSSAQNPDWYLQLATQAVRASLNENMDDDNALGHIATGVHYLICSAGLAGRFEESNVHIRAFLKFLPYVNTNSLVGYWDFDTASSLDLLNAAALGEEPII